MTLTILIRIRHPIEGIYSRRDVPLPCSVIKIAQVAVGPSFYSFSQSVRPLAETNNVTSLVQGSKSDGLSEEFEISVQSDSSLSQAIQALHHLPQDIPIGVCRDPGKIEQTTSRAQHTMDVSDCGERICHVIDNPDHERGVNGPVRKRQSLSICLDY